MAVERLTETEIADLIRDWPGKLCDLALEVRDIVLKVAPELSEGIAIHSLCYDKPDGSYGKIGVRPARRTPSREGRGSCGTPPNRASAHPRHGVVRPFGEYGAPRAAGQRSWLTI